MMNLMAEVVLSEKRKRVKKLLKELKWLCEMKHCLKVMKEDFEKRKRL